MSDEAVAEPSPALIIDNLSVWIGEMIALRQINFTVPERKITAIIGPSGCGKSILLRTIVGLFQEEVKEEFRCEGRILYKGYDLLEVKNEVKIELLRRRIAYVNQASIAFPMSIYDNISLGVVYWVPGLRQAVMDEIVERSLREVGLWDEVKYRLSKRAVDLSAGQLQRLAFARALAIEPEILLLDEPCAYTDPISTSRIEELLYDLRVKQTVLIVTHNMQQASRISDQVLFMYLGELIEVNSTDKIFINPKTKQAEDFITGRFG
jgi:phosphate transport system ATP-binding protein